MKKRGLGWLQVIIGSILILRYLLILLNFDYSDFGAGNLGYSLGNNIEFLLIGLFALVTGMFTLKER